MAARDYILHNFWWKLLSLLLAALTWLTIETAFRRDEARRESPVITISTSTRTFPAVPITLLTPSAGSNRFRVFPASVSVEVSGATNELMSLKPGDVRAFVDVTDAGDQKEFRRAIQAQVPGALKVAGLNPATNASVVRISAYSQP